MELKTFDIDPLHVCHCDRAMNELVGVVGGRYVEAEEAHAKIERLEGELAVANAVIGRFKDGCQELIDRYKIYS